MKLIKSFKALFFLFLMLGYFSPIFSKSNCAPLNESEMWWYVKNANGTAYSSSIEFVLYKVVAGSSGSFVLEYLQTGSSTGGVFPSAHIEMVNEGSNAFSGNSIFSIRLGADGTQNYCMVLRGVDYFYFSTGETGDCSFIYQVDNNGYWSISEDYNGRGISWSTGTFNVKTLSLNNSFNGGAMKIDNVAINVPITYYVATNSTHTLERVNTQSYGGYTQYFSTWTTSSTASSIDVTLSSNLTVTANFRRNCYLNFVTNGKPFTVLGSNYSSDTGVYCLSDTTITATASNYTQNGIDLTFLYWKKSGVIVQNNQINVDYNATYIAYYSGKPNTNNRAQYISTPNNQIVINWSAHPSSVCTTYNIYRRAGKTNPTISSIGTTSSLTFTDPDYTATGNMDDEWLSYDARPYYPGEQYITGGVESDPYFQGTTWGLILENKNENIYSIMASNELPTEFAFGNYPNPFNPETTINYQLPEKSYVTIKVYDILGKEVAELVNETKSAGYYQVKFNGGRLTSGIYIATIQASNFTKSIKLQLTK